MSTRDRCVPTLVFVIFLVSSLVPQAMSGESTFVLDPAAVDHELLTDIDSWVHQRPDDLRKSIRSRSESFEIFLSFHDAEARARVLDDLPYGSSIRHAADSHRVDPLLLAAVAEVESNFNPRAVSHRGAVGLVQVLPSTARMSAEGLLDPETNLDRGAAYLRFLLERFGGDLELALAGYNAGPGAVRRHGGVPPYRETRRYVKKVLEIYVEHHRTVWRTSGAEELDLV